MPPGAQVDELIHNVKAIKIIMVAVTLTHDFIQGSFPPTIGQSVRS